MNQINLFLLAIAFLMMPIAKAQKTTFSEKPLILETATGKLYGTLTLPKKKAQKVALLIAGSGPTDRNGNNPVMPNNSLKMLAEALALEGLAVLRYDKRGVAESTGAATAEADLRFEHYIADAVAWGQFLKTAEGFAEVVVIGHSEGSLIGMYAAPQIPAWGFVSLAGAGEKADQVLRKQLANQPDFVRNEAYALLDSMVAGQLVPDVKHYLNALFRPSVQPYLISWFRHNPQQQIATLTMPVLLVQGTTDIQVETPQVEMLAKAQPKAQVQVIEGMNHILKKAPADRDENIKTYSQPDLPLHPDLIPYLRTFLQP